MDTQNTPENSTEKKDDQAIKEHYLTDGDQSQPDKKRKNFKGLSIGLIVAALIVGSGGLAFYFWQQQDKAKTDLANERASTASLSTQIASLSKENKSLKAGSLETSTPKAVTTTDTLPSGKTLTYDVTDDNAHIIWWQSGTGATTVSISDKRVIQFLTTVDASVLAKECSPGVIDTTAISLGMLNLTSKTYQSNQYADCLATLSSDSSSASAAIKAQAKTVRDAALANVKRFITAVTIK
jgi:flagellar basal body-associated protein FliL